MNQENPQQTTPRPQKVLFVITKSNWGGAQRYVYDLATHLPATYEPVVACGPSQGSTKPGRLIDRLVQAGVRTIVLPDFTRDVSFSDIGAFRALYQLIKKEQPEVLHLNSSKAGALGALAGRLAGVPRIVFTVHGWGFQENVGIVSKAFRWTVSMLTVVLSHRVLCVSENDRLATPSFLHTKLVTIHNAIPEDPMLLTRDQAREKLIALGANAAHRDDVWIGVIAEHTANKNLEVALEAFAEAHKVDGKLFLVLVGDGELRASLESCAHDLDITDHVFFAGFVPQANHYMSAFDALLLTSRKEGLPYAILEAQSAGVPVLASRTGGIPEIVQDKVNGFLCPVGDVAAFAHALASLNTLPPQSSTQTNSFEKMLHDTIAQYSA